jgi:hypothetical protein
LETTGDVVKVRGEVDESVSRTSSMLREEANKIRQAQGS